MDLIKVAEEAFATANSTLTSALATPSPLLTASRKVTRSVSSSTVASLSKSTAKAPRSVFTVRKMSDNIGVERIFPIESPFIDSIVVNKYGKVRRAKLYYLRGLTGKKARIKERRVVKKD